MPKPMTNAERQARWRRRQRDNTHQLIAEVRALRRRLARVQPAKKRAAR